MVNKKPCPNCRKKSAQQTPRPVSSSKIEPRRSYPANNVKSQFTGLKYVPK
jgi:hypothetical protein